MWPTTEPAMPQSRRPEPVCSHAKASTSTARSPLTSLRLAQAKTHTANGAIAKAVSPSHPPPTDSRQTTANQTAAQTTDKHPHTFMPFSRSSSPTMGNGHCRSSARLATLASRRRRWSSFIGAVSTSRLMARSILSMTGAGSQSRLNAAILSANGGLPSSIRM